MWTLSGTGLFIAGGIWIRQSRVSYAAPLLAGAVAVGLIKAFLVLNRSADRVARRITERGDGKCLGGFLSWKTWILVAVMIALGRLLRASPLPKAPRGAIYCAVGTALLAGSARIWRVRARYRAAPSTEGST